MNDSEWSAGWRAMDASAASEDNYVLSSDKLSSDVLGSAALVDRAIDKPANNTANLTKIPASGRAIVGGVEYTVGGWGEYETTRRRTRWEISGGKDSPGKRYEGRTYIHADDAVRSIVGAKTKSILVTAAVRLGDALSRMEDRLCEPAADGIWECEPASYLASPGPGSYTVPALTSADMYSFAKDVSQQTDPEYMIDLAEDVSATAAALSAPVDNMPSFAAPTFPPLPARTVQVSNDSAVLQLESAVTPYVATLEKMQAELATRLDSLAATIDRRLPTRRP